MVKIGPSEDYILNDIENSIRLALDNAGIFNRVFSRIKPLNSINRKIELKKNEYQTQGKKMQDLFGIRVTLYFQDDEALAIKLVSKIFTEKPESHSIDPNELDRFGPQRKNLIYIIPEGLTKISAIFDEDLIDDTFEIQFRTVLSEGWHEVEHDLRYKCKEDWEGESVLYRQLNGIFATLETCNWAMIKTFEELTYIKYKQKEWSSFFRNLLRIRFVDYTFSEPILIFLNTNNLAKDLLKTDRQELILPLTKLTFKLPIKMDNVLFIINRAVLNNDSLKAIEPQVLRKILDDSFS